MIHAIIWINLENIMLSERSQTQKAIYFMIPLYELSRIGKSIETESRLVVARGRGNRELMSMDTGFPFGVIKMFCN